MKIFLSWSGERSQSIADALKRWLEDVFQGVSVWMSDHDINAGSRWGSELNVELESSSFGVLCLTPENLNAPWILFEAGSLAKIVKVARVVPYRFQLKPTDIEMPLAQFQGVDADEIGTYKLLQSINDSLDPNLPQERLERIYEKWWPDLHDKLLTIPSLPADLQPQRSERELLEEIVQLVRSQQRQFAILNPVALMGLSFTTEEISEMSEEELENHMDNLARAYMNADTQAGKYLVNLEMHRIKNEIAARKVRGLNKNEGTAIGKDEA